MAIGRACKECEHSPPSAFNKKAEVQQGPGLYSRPRIPEVVRYPQDLKDHTLLGAVLNVRTRLSDRVFSSVSNPMHDVRSMELMSLYEVVPRRTAGPRSRIGILVRITW